MAIIFNGGGQITGNTNGNRVNIGSGHVVQVVNQSWGGGLTTSSSGFSNTFSANITVQSGNRVLVEYYMKQRQDNGNGTWNLARHQMNCTQTGATIWTSGFNGSQSNTIYQWSKAAMYNPGSGGTFTFQASASSWTGGNYYFPEDGQAWIRLSEITA
jgi:hypothetical protein